jgi:dTDP-4-dehydrorhamnose reductase
MRVLLTGGSGLLGSEFLRQAPPGWDIAVAVHRNSPLTRTGPLQSSVPLDITNREQVKDAIAAIRPEAVVHLGSIGSLDQCKDNTAQAHLVNVEGTRNLLEFSAPYAPQFVFSSTMYVFDGQNPPYDEEAQPNPVNYYAETKLEAEALVCAMSTRPLILRPMVMYGWHAPAQRKNWVTWLIDKLRRGEAVKVVDDVYNDYLWVADGAKAIYAALNKDLHGIFHLAGPEVANRYDFSRKVAETFGLPEELIGRVSSDYFSTLAQRPGNTACNIQKMREILGIEPLGIEEGLRAMKANAPFSDRNSDPRLTGPIPERAAFSGERGIIAPGPGS